MTEKQQRLTYQSIQEKIFDVDVAITALGEMLFHEQDDTRYFALELALKEVARRRMHLNKMADKIAYDAIVATDDYIHGNTTSLKQEDARTALNAIRDLTIYAEEVFRNGEETGTDPEGY